MGRDARRSTNVAMRLVATLVLAGGIALLAGGSYGITRDVATVMHYRSASASYRVEGGDGDADIDWDGLRDANEDVAAWVSVTGAGIDYPVCQATDGSPEYYLRHDLWGNYEHAGCPYIDHRTSASSPHCMVFGHHMSTGGMFSEIFRCHEQAEFDRVLGEARMRWSTPEEGTIDLEPICALRVDQGYDDIQWFEFESMSEMKEWLSDIDTQATAHSPNHRQAIDRADRVVTLVTCSSMLAGQRERTLVVFAGSI